MLKKLSFIFLSLITITSCQTGSLRDSFDASYKYAQNTPYGRYPETVTYTLAHMAGVNNSYMPEGDTSENNAYTRYLSKKLNIQNINKIDDVEDRYFKSVNYSILKKNIPDVMIINNYHDLQYLVEHDMIEDLSTAYKKCTTQRIKDIYNSYPSIFNHVTINGKLYAMPETNINDGPNLFWCREDWLKECGLQAPKTLTDVENIVRTFKKKKKTVGLVTDTSLTAGTGFSSEYLLNLYFASYNTYPKQWIMKGNQANYGSVDQNVKKVLSHLHELYKEGVLDQKFLERTSNNIAQLIIDGQCGAFFGPWWVPNNPLVTAKQKDASINWKPYRIETNKNGETTYHSINPSTKYVVVRKGFKHPEIIFKIISVIFDYLRYENKNVKEINDYYRLNVDPTARPISINVDYKNALHRSYENVQAILNGEKKRDVMAIDYPYAEACKNYLKNDKKNQAENWAAYASRIEALKLLETPLVKEVNSVYFGTTKTMMIKWWRLEEMEKDTYLKIICGKDSVSSFDQFVKKWFEHGGSEITKEVNQEIKK